MKLEVMGFSQQGLLDLGLDIEDAILLRWFIDYQGTQRMRAIPNAEDGKIYFWVSFSKVCEDLPMVTRSDRYMSRKFDKLVAAGVLAKYSTIGPKGKVSSFRIGDGDQYFNLISAKSPNSDMAAQNGDMAKSPSGDMQSNINSLPSNNNTGDNPPEDKGVRAHDPSGENEIEQFLSQDQNLRDVFNDFRDMRKKLRKPMTQKAEMLQINELKKLGSCVSEWIALLDQSIKNSWLSVYPLRNDEILRGAKPSRTPVNNAAFDGMQGGESVWD